jgi:hypothetical protein
MLRACAVWLALCGPVAAQDITRAELAEPTARYDHAVLGDALEWGALHLWLEGGARRTIRLPEPASLKISKPGWPIWTAMAPAKWWWLRPTLRAGRGLRFCCPTEGFPG